MVHGRFDRYGLPVHHVKESLVWRFITGIGIGIELVTIDAYIAELMPKEIRGRAFALNQVVQFTTIPLVALISWLLVPRSPLASMGGAGWC